MPNLVLTNLAKAQAKLQGQFQNGELRFRDPVLFKRLIDFAQIMFPSYNEIRTAESRVVEAGFITRSARALGAARSHNHTGSKGDSNILTPSWTPYTDEFFTSLKGGDNNTYSNPEILAGEIGNVVANFAEGLEDAAADFVFNNRTTINAATSGGTFDGVTNTFQINEATNGSRAVQITKSMMKQNKYNGAYIIVCDSEAFNKFEFNANQGTGNSENLTFQYSNTEFIHSVEMDALAAGLGLTAGFWAAIPVGMAAALPWIPLANRRGFDGKEAMYSTIANPVDGLSYAVHTYEERFDGTAVNTETQDLKTEYQISIDVAFDHAPLTVAGETPILAATFI